MIIECIGNRLVHVSEVQREHVMQNAHIDSFPISIGRKYVVYGVIFRSGYPWYLITEDKNSEYPIPHYAGFFKIIDDRVPVDWCFKWGNGSWPEGSFIPVEWSDAHFFEQLVDGNPNAVKVFRGRADPTKVS